MSSPLRRSERAPRADNLKAHNRVNPNRKAAVGAVEPRNVWRAGPLGLPVGSVPRPANTQVAPVLSVNTGGALNIADVTSQRGYPVKMSKQC